MNRLVLVDTSSWTKALRPEGDETVRARVSALLAQDRAAWCDAVRLELWNGVRGDQERTKLSSMETKIPNLAMNTDVWTVAISTASRARAAGITVPSIDLLIFACAKVHGVGLEHDDKHFHLLDNLR